MKVKLSISSNPGNLANAKRYYTLAQEEITRLEALEPKTTDHTFTTVLYNIGRLYEAENNYIKAEEFYKRITQEHPAYYDSMSI